MQRNSRSEDTGIPVRRQPMSLRLRAYLLHHLYAFFYSLGQLMRSPWPSAMTIFAIGVVLALPVALHVLFTNVQHMGDKWTEVAQISLFLKQDVAPTKVVALSQQLRDMPEIQTVKQITPAQALSEFQKLSGFDAALKVLDDNPLPYVLVLEPKASHNDPQLLEGLLSHLRQIPEVEIVQLDLDWLKRFYALLDVARQGILVLTGLLVLAVVFTIGNTVRLIIESRRDEIEIVKLIGASNGFVRRPFLYSGFWFGLWGALIACGLVYLALFMLQEPLQHLSALYGGSIHIKALNPMEILILFGGSIVLGLLGAWLAVGRHLRHIEPS